MNKIRMTMLAPVAALSLTLAGCGPSIEDQRATATAELQAMTYIDPSERDRRIEQVAGAQSGDEINRIMDEARAEDGTVATTATPAAAAMDPLLAGHRWTFDPSASATQFRVPGGEQCFIEFEPGGTLGTASTLLAKDCLNVPKSETAVAWTVDPSRPDSIRINNTQGQLVWNLDAKPNSPAAGQVTVEQGNTAPFSTLVFNVGPIGG